MRISLATLYLVFAAILPDQASAEALGDLSVEGIAVIVRRGPEVAPESGRGEMDQFYTRTSRPVRMRDVPSAPRRARAASGKLVIRDDLFYFRLGEPRGASRRWWHQMAPHHFRHPHNGKNWPKLQRRSRSGREAWRLR